MKIEGSMELFSPADELFLREEGRESKRWFSVLHGEVHCLCYREAAALLIQHPIDYTISIFKNM